MTRRTRESDRGPAVRVDVPGLTGSRVEGSRVDVALVAMPFAPLQTPSLGLGLLHAALAARSVVVKTLNFSFQFAQRIGVKLYDQISDGEPARADLVGEWVFNGNLFDVADVDVKRYVDDVLRGGSPHHAIKRFRSDVDIDHWVEKILWVRAQTASFLAECVTSIGALRPRIVGITSMFEEHVPALSLSKRFKMEFPETFVVLGGANCEGPMGWETAKQFPFVDAVVSGEADVVFPELVDQILHNRSLSGSQGVYLAAEARSGSGPSLCPPVHTMDNLPYPDFDDHFEQLEAAGLDFSDITSPHLMFETARGCWWGQVQHCTFCGLNGATIAFRSKSPTRALDELVYLTRRYSGFPVAVSDNILDHKYLKEFVPALTRANPGVELFYEVKANLKKEEVAALHRAGITRIQPGIESFSTKTLKLMRKGVSAIQNIQLLKWCKEIGVTAVWGLLWGFPSEEPDEYARMASLIPLLTHLTPPIGVTQIRLDRFSPNHANAAEMGFTNVAPFPAYRYVYPFSDEVLRNIAYFFTYRYADGREPSAYARSMVEAVDEWRRVEDESALFLVDKGHALIICDLRPIARSPFYVLSGVLSEVYRACDRARSLKQIHDLIMTTASGVTSAEAICASLHKLKGWGLMVEDNGSWLSLATALRPDLLSQKALRKFDRVTDAAGTKEGDEVVIAVSRQDSGETYRAQWTVTSPLS
jgi:ribosomal peptide maturation radical SAM protein 1